MTATAKKPVDAPELVMPEKRSVKKLTIKIEDPDAIFAAYPSFKREDYLSEQIDKSKLRSAIRPIVKALHDAGVDVPGVKAFYATKEEAPADSTHNQLA